MAVELDHSFATAKPIDESYAAILDLERLVPCVEGGTVLEKTSPTSEWPRSRSRWERCR